MSVPKKILHYLGYNTLGLMMDQDRKHWLLRVDKNKSIQDKNTGEIFRGVIDNAGSDIFIESEKSPVTYEWFASMKYEEANLSYILEPCNSAFTFSISVVGLMFARIKSINYPTSESITNPVHRIYRMKLENCEECIIAFGNDTQSSDVFGGRWLKTTTPPTIQCMDDNGNYTINVSTQMNGCTNAVYYYPLNENIQPFNLTYDSGSYYTSAIDDNEYIGLPLYWYTCDESKTGPTISIENNSIGNGSEICILGNPGNGTKYNVDVYVDVDGNNDATPDSSSTSYYKILCHPLIENSFINSSDDFKAYLNNTFIMKNTDTGVEYPLTFVFGENELSFVTMCDVGWTYVDNNTYEINMSTFDTNCLNLDTGDPLIPLFNVNLDNSIPFEHTDTTDIGFAGISMGSSNNKSEQYPRYPHDLNAWDGLPKWINELDPNVVPAHMLMYAIHNTNDYDPSIPESRQTAAIILDPGKKKTDDGDELTNDERGRAYLLSNDDTQYRNNAVELNSEHGYAKPARTIARICDIPTSVTQLTGVTGLSPDPIVDKKYVRSYASYTEEDKNRLWNVVNSYDRWVRPTANDELGNPITSYDDQNGNFVFDNESLLMKVDMYGNNYQKIENLNPYVDPTNVHISSITDPGIGYSFHNQGKIIVGGFSFTYEVESVDEDGGVTEVAISFNEQSSHINLADFDMLPGISGATEIYGTAPLDPSNSGTGLKVRLFIEGYVDLLPIKTDFLDGIHAFVKCNDGIYLFEYMKIDNIYRWVKTLLVSPFEKSSVASQDGLSTPDAYMTSIIPRYHQLTVQPYKQSPSQNRIGIDVMSTASFVNIIDTKHTPLTPNMSSGQDDESILKRVDLCSWRCDRIIRNINAPIKNFRGVLTKLKELGVLLYDCYVVWRWVSDNDDRNTLFDYGIITRSMNNYVSTDVTTTLPANDLLYKKYVHTNNSTTIVWDAPGVMGVMMWIYDPSSSTVEKYTVDPNTQDLYAEKDSVDWNDVMLDGTPIVVNNAFDWNIMTNNPVALSYNVLNSDVIYQQPEFVNIISKGESFLSKKILPVGNWKLVFPRCESFKLTNINDGTTFKPIKLQLLRGQNLPDYGDVIDENGNTVNPKTLILNSSSSGISLNAYNMQTGGWEKI
jgi:hypothetical protein